MLTIEEMAQAITATRRDFSNLFLRAQVGLPLEERRTFEALEGVARSADDKQAFAAALRHARLRNWLDALIDAILADGLEDGHLADDVRRSANNTELNAQLQAILSAHPNLLQPYIFSKGVDNGMRWTGKILIDGSPQGTGLLIANNRVLTAWHVVKNLFFMNAEDRYEPDPAGGARLEVIFDDFLQMVGRGQGLRGRGMQRVNAHTQWCVAYSNCHEAELESKLPADLSVLEGHWDYAIIRLARPIGFNRGWANLDLKAAVPMPKEKVVLMQHPEGQTMRMVIADIADAETQQRTAIPRLRFLHYGDTTHGSSGGPCFDKSLVLFGFHQGEWTGVARPTNRGVPIARVIEHMDGEYNALKQIEPDESLIWKLGPERAHAPVIGCDDFQQTILQSSLLDKPKIFEILGETGSGKTFHIEIVSAMLPDAGHLKINLKAEAISKMDALALANVICSEAGAVAPVFAPPSEIHSTTAVWLKDEVVRKLIEAIDRVRNGRFVWLSISDLNSFEIEGENASQMLFLLYEQILTVGWLRILLDGMRGDIPASLRELLHRHIVRDLTQQEIESYFQRLATYLNLNMGAGIMVDASRLFRRYDNDRLRDRATAVLRLSEAVMETAESYMAVANQS
jgi:ABC-type dipeptide/oligopeptide/nickel transport system ATPase component